MIWAANRVADEAIERIGNDCTPVEARRIIEECRSAPRDTRDSAGKIGTAAHAMIEANIDQTEVNQEDTYGLSDEEETKAMYAYKNFLDFRKTTHFDLRFTEERLVHPTLQYGGTLDCGADHLGMMYLLDWKSSNKIYEDYYLQVGAYIQLWKACHPDIPIADKISIVRFDKESLALEHHYLPFERRFWGRFVAYRMDYEFTRKDQKKVMWPVIENCLEEIRAIVSEKNPAPKES